MGKSFKAALTGLGGQNETKERGEKALSSRKGKKIPKIPPHEDRSTKRKKKISMRKTKLKTQERKESQRGTGGVLQSDFILQRKKGPKRLVEF